MTVVEPWCQELSKVFGKVSGLTVDLTKWLIYEDNTLPLGFWQIKKKLRLKLPMF